MSSYEQFIVDGNEAVRINNSAVANFRPVRRIRVYFKKDIFLRNKDDFSQEEAFMTPEHFRRLMSYRRSWERIPEIRLYEQETDGPEDFIARLLPVQDPETKLFGWFRDIVSGRFVRADWINLKTFIGMTYQEIGINYFQEADIEKRKVKKEAPTPKDPKTGDMKSDRLLRETYYMEELHRPPPLSFNSGPVGFAVKRRNRTRYGSRKGRKSRKNLKRAQTRKNK